MRKALLLLTFLTLTVRVYAQEIEWQNTIGGDDHDQVECIISTSDGGYLAVGFSQSNTSFDKTENTKGGWDYWIVKIDLLGSVQWDKTIGGNGTDFPYSVIQTIDGGYLVGGWSDSNSSGDKTEDSNGSDDFWIVKIDPTGNIQWQNTIGGSNEDRLYSITQATDGGYLLAGYSGSPISGDKTEDTNGDLDCWMVKVDSVGVVQWQNSIGGSGAEYFRTLISTSDGGYLVGGNSNSNISGDKTENCIGNTDYWIVKTDSIGNIQWQNTIGGSNFDELFSILQTADNGYLLGGSSESDISGDKTENSKGSRDYWIVKTDQFGTIQWQNTIGGANSESIKSIYSNNDGGYLLGGSSYSNLSADKTEDSFGLNDYWIVNIDSVGNIVWQNTIGGDGIDMLTSLFPGTNGGFVLAGGSNSDIFEDKNEMAMGSSDYWIVKISDESNLIEGKTYADLNSNQLQEPMEPAIPFCKITESSTGRFGFSQASGFYSVAVLDTGNFEVAPDYLNLYNPIPLVHTVNFTAIQQIDSLNDFAFQPTGTFNDLCLTITPTSPFRSGFNANYNLNYSNQGTTTLIPTIVFYPDTNVSFVSASIAPTTITNDSVTFVLTTLTPFQSGQITITVSVDLGLPIGTLINSGAMILPIANDANPGCNSSNWEVLTTGSFDPNDILVNRSFIYDYEMPSPPDLEYIIRFQNTGNDTAFTVKILNPIDTTRLNLSTLDIVTTSHDADVRFVYHERNLEFVMNNILLLDSNTNEPMSHGFVRYRIKPKTTVAVGDSIQNFAAIYFDFNSPVITNTAVTHIILPTGLTTTHQNSPPAIFPNPVTDEINIEWNNGRNQKVTVELINI